MAFRVELTARAERDLEQIYEFINAADSAGATRWFDGLEDAIESLHTLSERGTATDYDPNLRFVLYGNKPHIYRILYRIHAHPARVIVTHIVTEHANLSRAEHLLTSPRIVRAQLSDLS